MTGTAAQRSELRRTGSAELDYRRARRFLNVLFWGAVAISIVHYADNYLAYDSYPQGESGPTPSAGAILAAWFVLTPIGLAGYLAFRRRKVVRASALLAVYSLSGLVGIGHYTVPGMTDAVWWRQAHVVADILAGVLMLGFAVWTARRLGRPTAVGGLDRPRPR